MKYIAEVIVKIKSQVKDTKGEIVARTIENCNFAQNSSVRTGAYYELALEANNEVHARNIINDISKNLLTNPIIEEYTILSLKENSNA